MVHNQAEPIDQRPSPRNNQSNSLESLLTSICTSKSPSTAHPKHAATTTSTHAHTTSKVTRTETAIAFFALILFPSVYTSTNDSEE